MSAAFTEIELDQLADVAGGISGARIVQVAKHALIGAAYAVPAGAVAGAAIGAAGGGIGAIPGALVGAGVAAVTGAVIGGTMGAQLPLR